MKTTKKYWKGLAQLNDDPVVEKLAQNEFVEELPVDQFLGNEENLSSTNKTIFDIFFLKELFLKLILIFIYLESVCLTKLQFNFVTLSIENLFSSNG